MRKEHSFNRFLYATTAAGLAVVLFSIYRLSLAQLDWRFLALAAITIGIGSRLSVTIPHVKAEITVADTLVFFAMFLYGGEPAVLLAAAEGLVSSWHVSRKSRVFFFNFAQLTCSTFLTASVLRFFFGPIEALHLTGHSTRYLAATCVMASVQCIASSGLVAIYTALKNGQPVWNTWRRYYLWTSITYFAGASVASVTAHVIGAINIYAAILISPIIAIIYFSYRTYLKNAEASAALRKSEERYRELFENAKDAYYVHDLSGTYISVNRAAEKLAGYPRAEIIGKKFSDFIAPEHLEVVNKNLSRKLIDEGETKYEIEVVASDGRRVPVEVSSHLIYENGVVSVQGTARDITERKRAEEALRQSEREYRGLFENAHDAILIVDPERKIVLEVNQRACELYGISRSEFIGLSLEAITKDVERGRMVIKETLERGTSHDFETVQRRGDGTEMFLHINASVVEYNGKIAIQSINRDITEQKRAEEALRQSEERFSKAFHSSPAALSITLLEDGRLLEVNAAFLRMTGFSREEVIGRTTLELGLWDSQHRLTMAMAKALREHGPIVDFEIKFRKKSGEIRDALLSVELIQLGLGEPSVLGIAQDVTERNRAEEALQSYPRQLIEAQEAERQSIARELHDQIGQVLTAIHLNLQAVWKASESTEARALIDEGLAIVDQALGQVRNLSFELRPSLLDDLGLATALRWYTDRYTQRTGIRSTTTINLPEPPARLTRDLETACFRIVQEALTNVVRHARAKNVAVRLQKRNGEIRLTVKDDGNGFDAHSQNLAPFTTHVGLRGMRERALALGGRLDVRSSSRGTRISANFPNENKKEDLASPT